ncbi:MAG: zf-HC2 domain-containing protein [Proteobacteria bacterium]|nr:zf-HC2 domain-containing protein [Pseudomonadota bacterium]
MKSSKKTKEKITDDELGRYLSNELSRDVQDETCPSANVIAKFIDGRLEGRKYEDLTAHLASCSDCYEIFSGAVALQEELALEKEPAVSGSVWMADVRTYANGIYSKLKKVLENRNRNLFLAAPAMAAAMFTFVLLSWPQTPPSFTQMVASLTQQSNAIQLSKSLKYTSTSFSIYGSDSELWLEKATFKAGVLLCGLEVALRAGDKEKSLLIIESLVSLVESLNGKSDAPVYLRNTLERIQSDQIPESILDQSQHVKKLFEEKEVDFFLRFGEWVQTGKLAASTRNKEFFTTAAIDYFQKKADRKDLPLGIGQSLMEIRRTIDDGLAQENDFKRLEKSLDDILEVMM